MTGSIYRITNTFTDDLYVGQTTKTITHQGVVKTITVSDVEIADSGATTQTGLATVRAYDAANNSIGALTLAEGTGANSFVNSLTIVDTATAAKTSSGSSFAE